MAVVTRSRAIERLVDRIKYATYAHEYAEPGYTDPPDGAAIIFANWNDVPERISRVLESFGCALEWSDEWSTCYACNKAFRTSPDCMSWHPSYAWRGECELLCRECAVSDPDEFLTECAAHCDKHAETADLFDVNPVEHGWIALPDVLRQQLGKERKALKAKGYTDLIFAGDDWYEVSCYVRAEEHRSITSQWESPPFDLADDTARLIAADWLDERNRSAEAAFCRAGVVGTAHGRVYPICLDEFDNAYIECALWSSTDESTPQGGEPLDRNYDRTDIHPDTFARMLADCHDFLYYLSDESRALADDVDTDLERAGSDFWLSRNRHGAGFWDGDWPIGIGEALHSVAEAFGGFNLYIGDDGLIHGS